MSEGRAPTRGQRVEVWTTTHRLVGYVYLPAVAGGVARLSDVINDPQRLFLPLVRVAMYRRGQDEIMAEQEFVLVNRASIEVVRPLD